MLNKGPNMEVLFPLMLKFNTDMRQTSIALHHCSSDRQKALHTSLYWEMINHLLLEHERIK